MLSLRACARVLILVLALAGCSCDEPDEHAAAAGARPADDSTETALEPREEATEDEPATAEHPPLPTPPRSEAARRRALLAEGRTLERAGDHDAAIDRYERALDIAPGDATLLGELGWALFRANRLDAAFVQTRDAYERATHDDQRGMLLYNLGRIAEARGHGASALELYRRSLAARPNAIVRARIEALNGVVPRAGEIPVEEWVRSYVVQGEPAASLEALCDTLVSDAGDDEGPRCSPALEGAAIGERGILEAGFVTVTGVDMADDEVHHLVARTERGWFVVGDAGSDYYGPSSLNGGESSQHVEVRDVIPGGSLELVATITMDTSWAEWCEAGGDVRETMIVCGVIADRIGCYLEVTTRSSSRSGTWRDGEGWAAAGGGSAEAEETCRDHDGDVDAIAGASPEERTIDVDLDEAGRVSFSGTIGHEPRARPAALAEPIELARVPCLGPLPDPLFACTAP